MTTLVDAAAVAEHLGVSRDYVYEHAGELGARRLGSGPRARLRFSLEEVDERLRTCSASRESHEAATPVVEPIRRHRKSRAMGTTVALLPIKGSAARAPVSQRADARDTVEASEMAASTGRAELPDCQLGVSQAGGC